MRTSNPTDEVNKKAAKESVETPGDGIGDSPGNQRDHVGDAWRRNQQ